MFKKIALHPLLLFPVLTVIFFWPLSLQIFTFKNDALTYYYPVRTLISDALNNFELPLWTPYINMGYPLHADMQSGAWNPVIWIIAWLTHYSLAAFHYEVLLYLSLAGIGFYYLGKEFGWNKYAALLVAIAYEFSGPLVDSMQFTAIISSAAYIPFVFLYFRRLLQQRQAFSNALRCAFCLFLLFTGGYPAIIIITFYLLMAFFLFSFFTAPQKSRYLQRIWLPATTMVAVFVLLALPAIVSFLSHLPFIDRGKQQQLAFVLQNSMPPACMFSLISPFSTTATAEIFNTDPLMRNVYIGIVPLLFFVYACLNKSLLAQRQIRFFLITAFTLIGMAWGSHFFLRQLAYYVLPLMDTFRHPALFRLFAVIFLLLIAGSGLNEWQAKGMHSRLLKRVLLVFATITCLIAVATIILEAAGFPALPTEPAPLKNSLAQLEFGQRLLLQLPIILITTGIFVLVVYRIRRISLLLGLCIADLFFATSLNMPVTVIGATRFTEMVRSMNRNPIPFPLPGNASIEENSLHSMDSSNATGSTLHYRKRIGRNDYFITPGNLSLQDQFYGSAIKGAVFQNRLLYFADTVLQQVASTDTNKMASRPFAIVTGNAGLPGGAAHPRDTIAISSLSANSMVGYVQTLEPRLLVFLQNSYPGWKAFIDGRETAVMKTNISFMGLTVPPGEHRVLFRYKPGTVLFAWYLSMLTMVCMGLLFIRALFCGWVFPNHHYQ